MGFVEGTWENRPLGGLQIRASTQEGTHLQKHTLP